MRVGGGCLGDVVCGMVVYFCGQYLWLLWCGLLAGLGCKWWLVAPAPARGCLLLDLAVLSLLCPLQSVRHRWLRRGLLCRTSWPLAAALLLATPGCLLGLLYLALYQSFVLRLDLLLVSFQLFFEALVFSVALLRLVSLLYYR